MWLVSSESRTLTNRVPIGGEGSRAQSYYDLWVSSENTKVPWSLRIGSINLKLMILGSWERL